MTRDSTPPLPASPPAARPSSTSPIILPIERNSDDFIFDNEIIAQAVKAGARIGELSCPTRYEADSSSINLRRSIRYGLGVLRTCADYQLHQRGLRQRHYLDLPPQASFRLPLPARSPEQQAETAEALDAQAG